MFQLLLLYLQYVVIDTAPSEGSISMDEGEEFNIVEQDQGDGWLRVRRSNGEEGFVPTSYVECHFQNS